MNTEKQAVEGFMLISNDRLIGSLRTSCEQNLCDVRRAQRAAS